MRTTVTFDRIGRRHNPPPLVLTNTDDGSEICHRIWLYAVQRMASRDVSITIIRDVDGSVHGEIFAGVRSGGTFRITQEA